MQMERQDFGVPPTAQLHGGAMHGPTPASIPGGQVITTKGLVALVQERQVPFVLFDVLGQPETLPNAVPAAWLAKPGSFDDAVQQQAGQMLEQLTQGGLGRLVTEKRLTLRVAETFPPEQAAEAQRK